MNESTLVPREEMNDLDWLARNVHVWPAGDHQPWCYVYMAHGGVMKAAGNFLDAVAKPTMITIDQWLARRAELQDKLLARYPSGVDRAALMPVFTDRDAFLRVAALDNHDQVYVLVLNRQGEILARAEGRFDAAKAEALRETLQAHEF